MRVGGVKSYCQISTDSLNLHNALPLATFFLKLNRDTDTRRHYRYMPFTNIFQFCLKYILFGFRTLMPRLAYNITGKSVIVTIAYSATENEICGICHIDVLKRVGKLSGELGIAILSKYSGQGIGRTILSECLEKCSRIGIHTVLLNVDVDNYRAIKLYERFGFKVISRVHSDVKVFKSGGAEDEFQMELLI